MYRPTMAGQTNRPIPLMAAAWTQSASSKRIPFRTATIEKTLPDANSVDSLFGMNQIDFISDNL